MEFYIFRDKNNTLSCLCYYYLLRFINKFVEEKAPHPQGFYSFIKAQKTGKRGRALGDFIAVAARAQYAAAVTEH